MQARIYKPSRNAMQSGKSGLDRWILEFAREDRPSADPLMGTYASSDMLRHVRLSFDSRDQAVAYAERNGIAYRVSEGSEPPVKPQFYAENFRYTRVQPWTH
ncbi:MAG: ETC complex I subunit [Alphaproteobacteria bacterium]